MRCMLSRDQACYRVSLRCQHSHTRRPMLHLIAQPCMFACCLQDLKHTLMVPSCLHFDIIAVISAPTADGVPAEMLLKPQHTSQHC
jgi:hypothetical protein